MMSLEIFSGSASWPEAMRASGWVTQAFDYDSDPADDILCNERFSWLLHLIIERRVGNVRLGAPCRSWTRARDPPLRSDHCLVNGLPGLTPHPRSLVVEGNELLRRSLVILNLCCAFGIPVTLENPESSRLWLHPEVRRSWRVVFVWRGDGLLHVWQAVQEAYENFG